MRLKFLRYEQEVDIDAGSPALLQVEDSHIFARMVASLLSERGVDAVEPYCLYDACGKKLSPKKALTVINTLPDLPISSRSLLTKMYAKALGSIEENGERTEAINTLGNRLSMTLEDALVGMWGSYRFALQWDPTVFFKAFSLEPEYGPDCPLLEKCMNYLDLCTDAGIQTPIVMVNLKNFLNEKELVEFYDRAFFLGTRLLLMENSGESRCLENERCTLVDQDFISW